MAGPLAGGGDTEKGVTARKARSKGRSHSAGGALGRGVARRQSVVTALRAAWRGEQRCHCALYRWGCGHLLVHGAPTGSELALK